MQSSSEFPRRHTRGAEDPMGNTQYRRVIMPFGFDKELGSCVRLLGDFASDIMARPSHVEDGKFLCGISEIIKERLRLQQDLFSLGWEVLLGQAMIADRAAPPTRAPDASVPGSR